MIRTIYADDLLEVHIHDLESVVLKRWCRNLVPAGRAYLTILQVGEVPWMEKVRNERAGRAIDRVEFRDLCSRLDEVLDLYGMGLNPDPVSVKALIDRASEFLRLLGGRS